MTQMDCRDMLDVDQDNWPNCSVPDCAYKSCLSLSSDKCYAHTMGLVPPDPAEYFARGNGDE